MIIKLLIDGGDMKPGPTIAQKIGPLGINMGKIISEINSATKEFKGMKVPVILNVDPKTKTFKVEVSSPPTSALLKKELGIETGSGDHKKNKVGNLAIEQVIKIAKIKHPNMLAKDFKSAVKSVVGSCVSLGILVENKVGTEIEKDIEAGKYDKEILNQISEVSEEKKKSLKDYFEKVLKDQEAAKKAEEAAKAAEEAAKIAAAPAGATKTTSEGAKPAATAASVAGATTPAAKTTESKKETKKK